MKNTIPILAVIGNKGSGKTLFIEALTKVLTDRGYGVGAVKHIPHTNFTIDTPNTDTWRYSKAGAHVVVSVSPEERAVIRKVELNDDDLRAILKFLINEEVDVLIVEGFRSLVKDNPEIPKVVMVKMEDNTPEMLTQNKNILAVVGPINPANLLEAPYYKINEVERVADEIEKLIKATIIQRKLPNLDCGLCGFETCLEHAKAIYEGKSKMENCEMLDEGTVVVKVNGQRVPLNKFVQNIIRKTVIGFLSALKDVDIEGNENVVITLSSPPQEK